MSTYQNRTVAGHKSQITVIAMMIIAQLVPTLAWAAGTKPSSGNGSTSSPYQISTKEHLIWFRDVVNGVNTGVSTGASNAQSICGRLTADITSLGSWTAIGKDIDHKYAGTFDGDGHKITGLSGTQGLFGYTNDATVQKFTLEGSISASAGDLGSVVGTAGGNTHVFDVCSKVDITISGAVKHLGGIVGQYPATSGKELRIKGCTYAGAMDVGSSTDSNGGIIGYCGESANVEIEYCHFSGSITTSANNPRLGGILGYADDDNAQNFGYIQYCFLSGYVKTTYTNPTTTYIGIIAGYPRGNVPGVIKNNTYIANSKNSSTNLAGNGYNSTVTASTKNNKQITISVSGGSGGTTTWEYVNPTQTTWAKVQATASANSGKHLAKWTSSSSSSTAISTQTTYATDLSSSVGLYANFADHTYGSWITDKEAACLTQGKRHKVCTVCSDTQYDYPNAKGHGHGTGTKAGYTALYEWGTTDAPTCEFNLTCNDCSTKVRKTTIGTDASNTNGYYELTTDQASTCTATGVHAYTAWGKYSDSNGSATYDEKTSTSHPSSYKSGNYTVPKIAHTWVNNREHLKSAATCTEDAVYWQSCSKCQAQGTKTWTDTGTKTGHTWVNNHDHLKSEATCTADAVYWQSCSKCHEQGTDTWTDTGTKKDHDYGNYPNNGFGNCSMCHKEAYQPIEQGDGTEDDPYKIANAGQLYWFAAQVNGGNGSIHGQLTKDIVVNDGTFETAAEGNVSFHPTSNPSSTATPRSWTPIGTGDNRFLGTFDGDNHTVSGLYFNDSQAEYVGLFGYIFANVTIQKLGVINVYFVGNINVGGVAGEGYTHCTIDHCYTTGVVKGNSSVGGIIGDTNTNCKVTDCYSTATISGNGTLGGIAGNIDNDSSVERCYFAGSINDGSYNIGGIAGYCENKTTIKDCYSTATISGNSDIGGIAGNLIQQSSIQNCYSTSSTTEQYRLGGICGNMSDNCTLSYCYTDHETLCEGNEKEDGTNITNCEQGVSADRFKSGEVACKLYRQSNVWRQNLGTNPDPSPVLDDTHGVVYSGYVNCTEQGYANTKLPSTPTNNHVCSSYDSNGFGTCSKCQSEVYQPIEQGDGSQNNPYKIANAGQLYWFAAKVNGGNNKIHGQLTKDIVVNDGTFETDAEGNVSFHPTSAPSTTVTPRSWTPIGNDSKNFQGTFDGDNHTVSGLYFNDSLAQYVGLFGYVCDIVTIQKLGVINVYFVGNNNVGGVVGYGEQNCTIDHCYTTGVLKASEAQDCSDPFMRSYTAIGGIVGGISNNCKVTDCYSSAAISGDSFLGGIAGGIKDSSSVERCYFTGSINDGVFDIGGITGSCQKSTIKDCYSTATISGQIEIGGIAGLIEEESSIENCYSTSSLVDGICGSMSSNCTLSYCYTDNETLCGDNENAKGTNITNCEQEVSADRFKSGEVAYKLYKKSNVWRQNLTGESPDPSPVLDSTHGMVYSGYVNCAEQDYANTELPSTPTNDHVCSSYDSNGFGTCSLCHKEAYQPATGDGSEEMPYLIANAGQLYWFAQENNAKRIDKGCYAQLTEDIVVNDGSFDEETGAFTPTDTAALSTPRSWTPFTVNGAHFDGDNHTISGLYIFDTNGVVGLFESLCDSSEVKQLGVINAYFEGEYGGGIAAKVVDSAITDCHTNVVIKGVDYIGGICGMNSIGYILCCYTTGSAYCYNDVWIDPIAGGICGINYGGIIAQCYATGTVSGIIAGGICGSNETDEYPYNYAVIEYCYSTATLEGEYSAGICGANFNGNSKAHNYIDLCYTSSDQALAYDDYEQDFSENYVSLTPDQFASGEVALRMNGDWGGWYQNLGGEDADPSPVLDDTHGTVYYGYVNCTEQGYANTELPSEPGEHSIGEDGGCDLCGYNKPKVEVVYDDNAKTMTWYYGRESHAADSVTVYTLPDYTKGLEQGPAWIENITPEKVIFDASMADYRPVSCNNWFSSLGDITEFVGLQYLNTSKVRNMSYMFYDCSGLQSLDLHTFVTDSVTDMALMFYGCNLKELTICFNTANVTNLTGMFDSCYELTTIYSSCDFVLNESLPSESHMFGYATKLKGGQGTEYSGSHFNHDYARIDDPEHGRPGYFTQYYAPGDVNQNGTISLADLCSLITYVGASTFPSQADMNHDSAVTEADVALLRDLLLGR